MPARLRLPLALLTCVFATATLSLTLWRTGESDVRSEGSERANAVAAALEERANAAILALKGVRAGYDASPSVDAQAFSTYARVALARPEIVAVAWAPRVAAAQRGELEASERIRIAAPADALFTYPLIHEEPATGTPDTLDLGSHPSLGAALRVARTTGEARFSAPVRLARDGRLGFFAFVPVFARDLPLRTPGERRDALLGVVTGALAGDELVRAALAGLPQGLVARVTDGPAVLAHGPDGASVALAHIGGRTLRVSIVPAAASPLAPLTAAGGGLTMLLLLVGASARLRRRAASEATLTSTLVHERKTSTHALERAASQMGEEREARTLVADATETLVLELDRDGLVTSSSSAVEELLGYGRNELAGAQVSALIHPDDLFSHADDLQRWAHKDGSWVALETSRLSRRDELGFVNGVVNVLRRPPVLLPRTAEQRIQDAVALEPDAAELVFVVAEEVARDLEVDAVSVVRFEREGFGTVVGAWEPRDSAVLVPGSRVELDADTPAGAVFQTDQPVAGAAPVRVGARLWGAVVAVGGNDARLRDLALAAQPALALADAAAQLAALATRDALTNLPDHRAFGEQLRAEARRARRHERSLSLVLLNIDGFKAINAEYGRLAGDRVLAEVARRLTATVRNGELVARLSADHFAWILPETEGLNGWIAAERARRAVAAAPIDGVGQITISAGVCDFEDVGGADELLALAEVALLHAKSSGADATFRYSAELDQGSVAPAATDDRGLGRLRALARELDAEDPGTEGHSERVARLSEKLALSCGWATERAVRLGQAALLHDVGKLGIDEDVLAKPGPLSREEFEQIRNHPEAGAKLAENALDEEQLSWIRGHHERWDGGGYPHGAAGEAIPAGARLLALAEAWDAMTSSRIYGQALSRADALAECRREGGAQFAPEALGALERLWALGALDNADVRSSAGD
jgi:diguanylate cyclase (GGDEF)-like protein/PAS domain S-box-containing protein